MPNRSGPRSRFLTLFLALGAVSLTACAEGDMPADDAQASAPAPITMAEVDALRTTFHEAMLAGDAGTAAAQYAEDAVFHNADGTKTRGRGEIQAALAEASGMLSDVVLTPRRTEMGMMYGFETGTVTGTMADETGSAMPVSLTYLVVFERQPDGSLKIVQDAEWAAPAQAGSAGMQ